jgi:hypothetical protein
VPIKKAVEEASEIEEIEQAEAETDFLTESGHISSVSIQAER